MRREECPDLAFGDLTGERPAFAATVSLFGGS
jgi:hypothetical protein